MLENNQTGIDFLNNLINAQSLYSEKELDLLQSLVLSNRDVPADVLERLLFSKLSNQSDSELRIDLISKILKHNPWLSINDTCVLDFTATPLMMFCAQGGSNLGVRLLQSSIEPDPFVKDNKDKHMLHLLIAKGHKYTAEPTFYSACDHEDQRPLFEAVLNHKMIRDHVNDQDMYGQTPLHYAAARRDSYYISKLISNGADPELCDKWGRNFFDIIRLSEQARVNIIGSALFYREEWNDSLTFKISHSDNPGMSIGAENGHNLGYFCGHIDKKVFNQDIEPLTNLIPKNKKIVQCGVFVGDKIENNMLSEEELVRERLNLLNEQSIPITHRSSKNNALQENKNTNLLKNISDYLVILKNKEEDLRTRKETIAANDLLKIVEKLKGYGDACQETGDLLYYKKKVEITLNLAKNNETLKSHRGFGRVYVILGKIAACVVRLFKPPSEPKYPFFNPKKTDTIKKVDAALLQFETEVNAWYLKNNKPH